MHSLIFDQVSFAYPGGDDLLHKCVWKFVTRFSIHHARTEQSSHHCVREVALGFANGDPMHRSEQLAGERLADDRCGLQRRLGCHR